MPKEPDWLQAERSGDDDLAEMLFAKLVAGMPPVQPSAAFVDRTVRTVWRPRTRHLRLTRAALIATVLTVVVFAVAAYAGSVNGLTVLAASVGARCTVVLLHGLVW